ncbi:MAG: hypothetical protein Q8N51_08015 [Gammaproteobacteria bacterium]|nr:hypothetical protein [Gammaproteobacteria bacterium]
MHSHCRIASEAMLPGGLAEGYHVIEIETTDQFGQRFEGTRILRVVSGE